MSAFICNPVHIATCAEILHERTFSKREGEWQDMMGRTHAAPHRADLRAKLGAANVASVAWRYSDDGRAAYEDLFQAIAGDVPLAPGAQDGIADMLPASSVPDYIAACRWAQPVFASVAEAFQYLSCLEYQCCEPPDWKASEVKGWIDAASHSCAYDLARHALNGRHVWEVREDRAPAQNALFA